jgi:hypothetical protein
LDAKARYKDNKKNAKGKEKEKKEWSTNAQIKFTDPAFVKLNIPTNTHPTRPCTFFLGGIKVGRIQGCQSSLKFAA